MCSLSMVMSFEELELVEALQCGARHVLARARGVAEHRVVRLVSACLDARLEAVACEERNRSSHFLVLRIAGRERTREAGGGAEMEAVLVVERLAAQNATQLRREHKGHVASEAAVLCFGRRAAGVVLAHGQEFQADGQRIDDGPGRYRVGAAAGAICRGARGFLTAIAGHGDRQRLDRVQRYAELQSLALVRVREL